MINKNSSLLGKYSTKEDINFKNKNDEGVLLLLEKNEENTKILKEIGFDNYILKVEKEAHIKNSKNVFSQLYGKPSFLGSEIKKVCNDYDLVISKVQNYNGAPFKDLPQIIQKFIDDNSEEVIIPEKTTSEKVYYKDKITINLTTEEEINKEYPFSDSDGSYKRIASIIPERIEKKSKIKTGYSNWFIMAPREAFHGNKKNVCCTLFYRDNDDSSKISENDVFLEVHSWGSNYSELRKYNYFLKNINWEKEGNLRNKGINRNDIKYQFISFIILLLFNIGLSMVLYVYSFKIMISFSAIMFLILYFSIRKPCKEYCSLWKI
jgi:hypothetical protein